MGNWWIFIGCHIHYDTARTSRVSAAVVVSKRQWQRNWGGSKVKLESVANKGTHIEIQQTIAISSINIHGYFNSHSTGKLVMYMLKNQYGASLCTGIRTGVGYRYWQDYRVSTSRCKAISTGRCQRIWQAYAVIG